MATSMDRTDALMANLFLGPRVFESYPFIEKSLARWRNAKGFKLDPFIFIPLTPTLFLEACRLAQASSRHLKKKHAGPTSLFWELGISIVAIPLHFL